MSNHHTQEDLSLLALTESVNHVSGDNSTNCHADGFACGTTIDSDGIVIDNNSVSPNIDGTTTVSDGIVIDNNSISPICKQNANDVDWINEDILNMIEPFKPQETLNAGDSADLLAAQHAFDSIFKPKLGESFIWTNQYQVEQTARRVASWYGFTTKVSATTIICGCSKSLNQKKRELDEIKKHSDCALNSDTNFMPETQRKKRNRDPMSSNDCPFKISCTRVPRDGGFKGLKKEQISVKATNINSFHTHSLNKELLIKAKRACHQYAIPIDFCTGLIKMMDCGPMPTLTLRTYLQTQFPNSQRVDATMISNFRMKCRSLKLKYGDVEHIPGSEMKRVFEPDSLEQIPEHFDSDPVFAEIWRKSMQEVLVGIGRDPTEEFAILKVMRKVKECQPLGYDYRVFTHSSDSRPSGVLHMTPYQIKSFIRYGDVLSIDGQAKRKNTFGWSYCGTGGKNNNNELVNFNDNLVLAEGTEFFAFILRAMCEISGRPLHTIKIITVDGKLEEDLFRRLLPGQYRCMWHIYCLMTA